ncbi:non-ltr retroelement reverse transcriptase [Hordeum vulgare]|nr:non-ltr retroelement reverse transcriptase [Hordeum vulgare]
MVNVDAALFPDCRRMAMGAIFRDHSGRCLAAASEPLIGFTSPEIAEALALRRAVTIADAKGFERVIFASDCLSLIQRLQSSKPDRSMVGSVMMDIKHMVSSFSSATFRHVRRNLNEATHLMARTCDLHSLGFISDFAPDGIRETLCIDVM